MWQHDLGSRWGWSAIWIECKHRHWGESKTSKDGNARMKKELAMWPGLAKIIEKVRISRYFESRETDLHIPQNACCMDYADTWSSKRVHWLSKSQSPHCGTTYYGCENDFELDIAVACLSLPITRIPVAVAPESNIQWIPATLHNTRRMDHCHVRHGNDDAIPIPHARPFAERLLQHSLLEQIMGYRQVMT